MNKNSIPTPAGIRETFTLREFVPSLKEVVNQDETHESYVTVELKGNEKLDKSDAKLALQDNGSSRPSNLENPCPSHEKPIHGGKREDVGGALPTAEVQAIQNLQNYPRHVNVHILDGSLGKGTQSPSNMPIQGSIFHPIEVHGNPNLLTNPAASTTAENESNVPKSSHQSFPTFHPPFTPFRHNQDDYQSFLHISSTFSSLIVSTLLQNPAAHAAASFAATFWPYTNMEISADSPVCPQGGFPSREMSSPPSMAAIVAATVAAATAWWTAHGLLPLCGPLHAPFTCPPACATAVPSMDTAQVLAAKTDKNENAPPNPALKDQQLDHEYSEALQAQNSASKSPPVSTSDSEESAIAKLETELKATNHEKNAEENELLDSNKTKNKKQVDRSSCGSNTPSSSEVETDALEKQEKGKEESQEIDPNLAATDSGNRRSRSSSNITDSWKEVSEEVIAKFIFLIIFSLVLS